MSQKEEEKEEEQQQMLSSLERPSHILPPRDPLQGHPHMESGSKRKYMQMEAKKTAETLTLVSDKNRLSQV